MAVGVGRDGYAGDEIEESGLGGELDKYPLWIWGFGHVCWILVLGRLDIIHLVSWKLGSSLFQRAILYSLDKEQVVIIPPLENKKTTQNPPPGISKVSNTPGATTHLPEHADA